MTVAAEPRLTLAEWAAMLREPVRDKSYLDTRLGVAVADYLSWKKNEDRAAARTLDQYERDLARLAVTLADLGAAQVTTQDIRRVRDSFPPGSRHRCTAVFKDFFRWLYEESAEPGFPHAIDRDPAARIRNRRDKTRRVYDIFTEQEEAALITRGPRKDFGRGIELRDRVAILCLLRAGLRAEGIRQLRFDGVDLVEKWLIVDREKGGDGRVVPVAGDLVLALEEYMLTPIERVRENGDLVTREPREGDHLLYPSGANEHGLTWTDPARPMVYSTFRRWWIDCVARAGVRYRKPHMNRHTYATKLRRSGADITDVQKALGHRSINSTLIYTHTDVRDVARSVERMERERETTRNG